MTYSFNRNQRSLNEGTLLHCLMNYPIFLFFQYRATTLPAFKYYVTCAYLIFFCIFIVQILVLPKYVGIVLHASILNYRCTDSALPVSVT